MLRLVLPPEPARFRGHATAGESLGEFLDRADNFRRADSPMRSLTEEEFLRGKQRLRRAVQHAEHTARTETRTNWLDLLVLR
jgi:hypothetical protein